MGAAARLQRLAAPDDSPLVVDVYVAISFLPHLHFSCSHVCLSPRPSLSLSLSLSPPPILPSPRFLSPASSVKWWICSPHAVCHCHPSLQSWRWQGWPGYAWSGSGPPALQRRTTSTTFWRWRRRARYVFSRLQLTFNQKLSELQTGNRDEAAACVRNNVVWYVKCPSYVVWCFHTQFLETCASLTIFFFIFFSNIFLNKFLYISACHSHCLPAPKTFILKHSPHLREHELVPLLSFSAFVFPMKCLSFKFVHRVGRPTSCLLTHCFTFPLSYLASQGYGFQPSYDGDELSCTVKNLHKSTKYKFRVRKICVVYSQSRRCAAFDFRQVRSGWGRASGGEAAEAHSGPMTHLFAGFGQREGCGHNISAWVGQCWWFSHAGLQQGVC